jgi:protein-S-isoprenylcysteine O-methyltransferase Ste14
VGNDRDAARPGARRPPLTEARIPELGPRGEGWVAIQSVLIVAIVGCGFVGVYWPGSVESFSTVVGILLVVAGAALALAGALTLGRSFTHFPRPRESGRLRQGGIYRLVRHPVYGGVLLLALGWSLAEAPLALVPTALLALVFDLKSRREEIWLRERYPDYAAYAERTRSRLVPFVY